MSINTGCFSAKVRETINFLKEFAYDAWFSDQFRLVFDLSVSRKTFLSALEDLPQIEIVRDEILQGARGAFSSETGKIYISESLLSGDLNLFQRVLIEEIGHYLDNRFNRQDTPGDEGEYFAALVLGDTLNDSEVERLKTEDDRATITIGAKRLKVERSADAPVKAWTRL